MIDFRVVKRARSVLIPFALAASSGTALAQENLASFGVLAGSTVTNTGATVINGNVGVSPGTAITGFFAPGVVNPPYTIHDNDAVAMQAQIDLVTAYNSFWSMPSSQSQTGQDLGGLTLAPGIYSYAASAQLTGQLTLDGQGNPNSQFVFQLGSTLTTASASSILLINGAQGGNVYFVVGSSATLGTGTQFAGNIMAMAAITLNTSATIICGSALARTEAVTLDTNTINVCVTDVADVGDVVGGETGGDVGEIAGVIDGVDSASLPDGFRDLISFLSPADLAIALSQLAGQAGTAAAPAGTQAMSAFLSQLSHRLDDGMTVAEIRSAYGDNAAPAGTAPADGAAPGNSGPGTVKVLGYGTDDAPGLLPFGQGPDSVVANQRVSTAWVAAFGEKSDTDGDALMGIRDRTIRTSGLAAGVDFQVASDLKIGVAFAAARSDFELSDNYGGGDSDILQAAIYARKDIGAAYISAALAYAWNDVTTQRYLTVGGDDRFDARFTAQDIGGRVEAGYRFELPAGDLLPGSSGLTPYAGIEVQAFRSPSYSETARSGSTDFVLDYDARTTTATETQLGLKYDRSMILGNNSVLILRTGIAWLHSNHSDTIAEASFQSLPGSGFTVDGAESAPDSLLLSAGAEFGMVNGLSLKGSVDGRFANGSESYSGTARVSYTW